MKIGLLAAPYASLSMDELFARVTAHGLEAVELGAGNYPGSPHLDVDRLLAEDQAVEELHAQLARHGLEVPALAAHGNPLHPQSAIADEHDAGLRRACRLAARLGVPTVVAFSGCPGDQNGGATPNWVTCPWPSEFERLLEWQWDEVAIPRWTSLASHAEMCGVRIAIEMHPGMLVYNPETLLRLRNAAGSAIGANIDPSHLVWQGIDVTTAVRELGRAGAIYHVHAKDTAVDAHNVARNGVIDTKSYARVIDRAWTFRTIGFGHDESFWRAFGGELRLAGYDGAISIEHEDILASVEEGIDYAVAVLRRSILTATPTRPWWT